MANTQSKQGVTLCRRKEIAGENGQGLCPRHTAPCPGLTFPLELCAAASAFPTDGCTAQSPVTCLSPSEAPVGERGPPTAAAGTQSRIVFAAQVAPWARALWSAWTSCLPPVQFGGVGLDD